MGEIDTKPMESVQNAISFFGQRINSPVNDENNQETGKEREHESLMKDLANIKLQLEAKDSAYKQALLKLDNHQKTVNDLSTLLKNSDLQKRFYINELREANVRVYELESAMKPMIDQISEYEKAKEQLLLVSIDFVLTKECLLEMERELGEVTGVKDESISKAEAAERALDEEKLKTGDLMSRISEMSESNLNLEAKALEIEKVKMEAVLEKEAELELAKKALFEAEKQLEFTMEKLETMRNLENQVMIKSAYIDSLQLELKQANELQISYEKTLLELKTLEQEMEVQEKVKSDHTAYTSLIESELEKSRKELSNAKAEASRINERVDNLKSELEKHKEKENDLQVEIALLKFELHKGRSKLAASEAAESKLQGEKSALYKALQEMGLEAVESKKENRILKEAIKETDEIILQGDENQENEDGVEKMRKELEIANSKMGELRTRAEQAISRADAAEKAKACLEDKFKKQKEHKERRKAALAALREESVSREFIASSSMVHGAESDIRKNQTVFHYFRSFRSLLKHRMDAPDDMAGHNTTCHCGRLTVCRMSWSGANPACRFRTCSQTLSVRCRYFEWIDPPTPPRLAAVVNGLLGRLNRVDAAHLSAMNRLRTHKLLSYLLVAMVSLMAAYIICMK